MAEEKQTANAVLTWAVLCGRAIEAAAPHMTAEELTLAEKVAAKTIEAAASCNGDLDDVRHGLTGNAKIVYQLFVLATHTSVGAPVDETALLFKVFSTALTAGDKKILYEESGMDTPAGVSANLGLMQRVEAILAHMGMCIVLSLGRIPEPLSEPARKLAGK